MFIKYLDFPELFIKLFHLILQKDNHYLPYTIDQVRHISYQLCYAVNCKSFPFTQLG